MIYNVHVDCQNPVIPRYNVHIGQDISYHSITMTEMI